MNRNEQEQQLFELGFAAFYAGHPMNFSLSKHWRDGWNAAFREAIEYHEQLKALGVNQAVRYG